MLNGAYAWGGIPTSTMTEHKCLTSGGDNNTDDDGGVVSSNIVTAPEAIGAQVMNIAGAWGGNPTSHGDFITHVHAGGADSATGKGGAVAGNIVDQASSLPVQVNTIGATWGGLAEATGTNVTAFNAGGPNYADGDQGAVAGNVVEAPIGGAGQVSSWAVSWIGGAVTDADNDISSHAGGTTYTSGAGALSGALLDVPVAADPEVFRWGVGALSTVNNHVDSTVDSQVSGTPTAKPAVQIPVGLVPQVKNVTIPVLAEVLNTGTDTTDVVIGRTEAAHIPVELDLTGVLGGVSPLARDDVSARTDAPGLGADGVGGAMGLLGSGSADAIGKATGALGEVSGKTLGGLPATVAGAAGREARSDSPSVPSVSSVSSVSELLGGGLLPQVKPHHVALPGVPSAPRADVPGVPVVPVVPVVSGAAGSSLLSPVKEPRISVLGLPLR